MIAIGLILFGVVIAMVIAERSIWPLSRITDGAFSAAHGWFKTVGGLFALSGAALLFAGACLWAWRTLP